MPITLVTGIPGHGKTLFTLVRVKAESERDKRPVFYHRISELTLDWVELAPEQWSTVPANGIMVIDEAQKVFPIRARGADVPAHVSDLETHRHLGVDIWLITQHPHLVDTHVRKLVDRHFHLVRVFGTHNATVYEFPSGIQDQPEKNRHRPGVVQHRWRYPKKAFAWYKSAEAHTVKMRVPMKVWLIGALLCALPVFMGYVAWRLKHGGSHAAETATAAPGDGAGQAGAGASAPAGAWAPHVADMRAASAYLDSMRPRLPGLAFTAPAYDHLTKPVEAPYPSVCAYSAAFPCRCWSQRGFKLDVPKPMCEQLAREPMDPYWLRRGPLGFERVRAGDDVAPGQRQAASAPLLQSVVQQ